MASTSDSLSRDSTRLARLGWYVSLAVCLAICLLAALHYWRMFTPGLLSFDSVDQYDQAVAGRYNDQHNPILAVGIAGVRRLGGDMQHVMLLQCVLAMLGVFWLAYECLRAAFGRRLDAGVAAYASVGVLLVLLSNLSPLKVLAMTFWKDVWLLVCLCWIAALALNLLRCRHERRGAAFWAKVAAYAGVVTLALLVRHNAILVAPVCCVILAVVLRPALPLPVALLAALLPLAGFWGAKTTIYRVFHVDAVHFERFPLGFELVSLCARHPPAIEVLPYTKGFLYPGFETRMLPGCWDSWHDVAHWEYYGNLEELKREYQRALQLFPMQLLAVKAVNFAFHLHWNNCLKYQQGIHEGRMRDTEYHFQANPVYAEQRDRMYRLMNKLFDKPQQWVFARHLPWFCINLAALAGLTAGWIFARSAVCGQAALVAAISTAYYASFFLVSLSGDFRYMYPATLPMQIATLALLLGSAGLALQRLWLRWFGPVTRFMGAVDSDAARRALAHGKQAERWSPALH